MKVEMKVQAERDSWKWGQWVWYNKKMEDRVWRDVGEKIEFDSENDWIFETFCEIASQGLPRKEKEIWEFSFVESWHFLNDVPEEDLR